MSFHIADHMPYRVRRLVAPVAQATSPGFSTCRRCGMPWCFVTERAVPYAPVSPVHPYGLVLSGFALCQRCWDDLGSAERRIPYYVELANLWESPHNSIPRDELRQRFRDSVLKESMA